MSAYATVPEYVSGLDLLLQTEAPYPLGIDGDQQPVCWDQARDPHLVVHGAPGAGWSVLLLQIALGAYAKGHDVVWIDPKDDGRIAEVCGLPAQRITHSLDEIVETLDGLVRDIERGVIFERPVVVLYDLLGFILARQGVGPVTGVLSESGDFGYSWEPESEQQRRIQQVVFLLNHGPSHGVHLVLAADGCVAEEPKLQVSFAERATHLVLSRTGAYRDLCGWGRPGLATFDGPEPHFFQIGHTPWREITAVVTKLSEVTR